MDPDRVRESGIFDRQEQHATGAVTPEPGMERVFFAARRKQWRGAVMVAAAVGAGVLILMRRPALDFDDPFHIFLVSLTWALFFWVAAQGIERFFEPMATLAARPEGLVLFPDQDPDSLIPWSDIRRFEVFRFGKSRLSAPFLTVIVDDPSIVSRHLPWHLKIAYRADRWAAGSNRYFRARSDFDVPVQQVVAELEAWRERFSDAPA